MRSSLITLIVAGVVCAGGCGGASGGSGPTSPSPATTSIAGTWRINAGDLTWVLTQTGASVSGTSAFSQDNGQFLGAVSGQGVWTGTISGTTVTFTDGYARLSRPECALTVTGTLTVSGSRMTGTYLETDRCNGAILGTINGNLDMRKQ